MAPHDPGAVIAGKKGRLTGSRLGQPLNPEKELVIISSDHGNFEDLSQGAHTENLVPTFLHGAQSEPLSETIRSLVDIPRAILSLYGMQMPQAE